MPARKKSAKPLVKNDEIQNAIHNALVQNGLSHALLSDLPNIGTQLNQTDTLFKNNRWYLVSNMRQLLSQLYVEHGLVQTIVDVPVDDGMRGGIDIKSKQLDPEQLEELKVSVEREDLLDNVIARSLKWNRLFGGAGIIILTDQLAEEPLDIEAIGPDSPLEFRAVDMWELFHDKQNSEGYDAELQHEIIEFYNYYGKKVHKSRVMKQVGLIAPSFVRPRLRGWGFSIVEALVNSINQYLKSNNLIFEVLDEFKVDVYKIKNLANTLLSPNGTQQIQRRVQLANQQKNFQNAITMDGEDDFVQKELTFSGIAETMQGIRMQIASDMRMPLTKIFGISSAGFSSGQDDIENYNGMVESQVRCKAKYDILKILELKCQKMFGFIPDDMSVDFKPLRVLTAEQQENVKNGQFARLMQALQAGQIDQLKFQQACNKYDLLGVQFDTESLVSLPPLPEQEGPNRVETLKISPMSSITAPEAPLAKNSADMPRIVSVGILCGDEILTGKRKDNGKWTHPSGHMEVNETPEQAAIREVYEESGIKIHESDLHPLPAERIVSHRTGKEFMVYPFTVEVKKQFARTTNDPDGEMSNWKWVPIKPETPELFPEARHAMNDQIVKHLLSVHTMRNEKVMNPGNVDEALWSKAKSASQKALGKVKYPFVTWWYKKHGGKFK